MKAARPDLLTDADQQAFAQAMQSAQKFRQLDHARHFDALLLSGDPASFRPLLNHLLETGDWTLRYLDHTSFIFRRGGTPWHEDQLHEFAAKFSGTDRAIVLANGATRLLLATGRSAAAKSALDEAMALDAKSPEVWNGLALYNIRFANWSGALTAVDHALDLDENSFQARTTKAQILYGLRRYDDALHISRKLIEETPDDPQILFFHARIAHESHAYSLEIEAMQHLIDLAEKAALPVSGYRIYLGQAYAANEQNHEAYLEFQRVAAAPDLSAEQREFVEKALERLKPAAGP